MIQIRTNPKLWNRYNRGRRKRTPRNWLVNYAGDVDFQLQRPGCTPGLIFYAVADAAPFCRAQSARVSESQI